MAKKIAIIIFIVLMISTISLVAAYVYETGTVIPSQTVKNIATLTLQNSALGNIEEGQTITYTKASISSLGNIFNLTTYKDAVYLHLASNLDTMTTNYSNYTIVVKYAAVGAGSSRNVGDTAAVLSISSPNPATVTLDKAGAWRFDIEITTTAKSVASDQATSPTITVTAENT
jgi:hypothetical protein